MCGRYVLVTDLSVIAKEFDIPGVSIHFSPSRNVSPGRHIPAIVKVDQQYFLASFLWGLIPFWAKDPSIGAKMINARAETIAQKPSFKNAFAKRRCLIPADGFYEWKTEGKKKIPYFFSLKNEEPFVFAGLYERWIAPDQKPVDTCAIVTTRANAVVGPIHDRMPVIVPKDAHRLWLEGDTQDTAKIEDILKPYPSGEMTRREAGIIG